MRPGHLFGTLLYAALGAAAATGAWLLTEVLGGALTATLPVGAVLLSR